MVKRKKRKWLSNPVQLLVYRFWQRIRKSTRSSKSNIKVMDTNKLWPFMQVYSLFLSKIKKILFIVFCSSSNSHPPPLPARPATASGALGKMGGSTHSISKVDGSSPTLPGSADFSNRASSNTSYHHQQQHFSRQRIQGLNASSTSSISREH